MDFILSQNNLLILATAVAAGVMLALPTLLRGRSGKTVGAQEAVLLANHKGGLFLDVRSADQFKTGSIPQARNVPVGELEARLNTLPKDKPIIVVCEQGRQSQTATALLRKHGFTDVVSLDGGLRAWAHGGLPLYRNS